MATNTVPALTTVFTPAASCLTDIYNLTTTSGGSPWIYLQLGPTPTSNNCYPSDFTPAPTAYYSPGICPSGYLMACSSIVNINSVSETRATCCPSAYTCQTDNGIGWPWYSTELCTLAATTTGTFMITAEPTATSTYIGTPKFNAYGIQIRWQLDNSPTKTSHTSTTTPQPTTKSQSVTSSPSSPPASSSGLSTGAKVGIGVGVGLGALVILIGFLVVIFFCRRRKIAADSTAQYSEDYSPPVLRNPNLYLQGELDASRYRNHPYELDSKVLPAELGPASPYHP